MREIKFRAWDLINRKWIPPMLVDGRIGGYRNGIELTQYTGLKDKNGKEIYEGDILSNKQADFWDGEDPGDDVSLLEVRMNTEHGVSMHAFGESPVTYSDEESIYWVGGMEVIGNIYENPELLDK